MILLKHGRQYFGFDFNVDRDFFIVLFTSICHLYSFFFCFLRQTQNDSILVNRFLRSPICHFDYSPNILVYSRCIHRAGWIRRLIIFTWFVGMIVFRGSILAATFTYSYDPLNRLTNAAYSDGSSESYSYDNAGNRLSRSIGAATVKLDTTSPSVPTNLVQVTFTPNQLSIAWNPSFDTGGSGLAGYQIYVNGSLISTATSTNFSLSGLSPNTQYCLTVAAFDHDGNVSLVSQPICFTTGKGPTNLLTVSANDLLRAYGSTNPQFTVSYTGFLNGDTTNVLSGAPSVTTSATTNSLPGAYAIIITNGTLNATNYVFSFVNGTLTVNPAILTVTANNTVRYYGETNPVFTVRYSGFVLNQDTNVLGGAPNTTTPATLSSSYGTYPIVVASGTLTASNYDFAFVNGTLTVITLPRLSSLTLRGNQFIFSCPSILNKTYQIQYTDDLMSNWTSLGSPITGTGNPLTVTNSLGSMSHRYFRVQVN